MDNQDNEVVERMVERSEIKALEWLKENFGNKQSNYFFNNLILIIYYNNFFLFFLELQLEYTFCVIFRIPIAGGKSICIPLLHEQDGTVKWESYQDESVVDDFCFFYGQYKTNDPSTPQAPVTLDPCEWHLTCKGIKKRIKDAGSLLMFLKDCLQFSVERAAEKKAKKRKLNTIQKTDVYKFPSFSPSCVIRDCCYIENLEEESSTKVLTVSNGLCPGTYNIPFLGIIDSDSAAANSEDFLFNLIFNLVNIISFRYSFFRFSANQFTSVNEEVGRVDNSYVDIVTIDPSMFFYFKVTEFLNNSLLRCILESMGGIFCSSSSDSYYLFVKHSPIFKEYVPSELCYNNFKSSLNSNSEVIIELLKVCPDFEFLLIEHNATKDWFDDIIRVSCTAFPHFEKPSFTSSVCIHSKQIKECLPIFTKNGAQLKTVKIYEEEHRHLFAPRFVFEFNYLNNDHISQLIKENNLPCHIINDE